MAISPTSPCATSWSSPSTTRICTPRMGVPIEPGLRSRSGWLNEAIGEVSDRPYPSSTVQPNASSTRADDIGARHLGVAHEVAVGEFGALRLAGRAGGVKDHRGVLVIPVRDLVVR